MLTYKQLLAEANAPWTPKEAYKLAKVSKWVCQEILDAIKKSPEYTFLYARDVIQGPWREGESTLLKNAQWAYKYAKDVLYHPWPEAEPYIKDSMPWAYLYATGVLRERWPEAEETIKSRPEMWIRYLQDLYAWNDPYSDVDDLGILLELLRLFPNIKTWNMTFGLQKKLLQTRPDLVGTIKNLDPNLKARYQHEVEFGNVDL